MADADVLTVEIRNDTGKRVARRLRSAGKIPAVIYGHGETSVSLAVSNDQIKSVLRHGGRVVSLTGGVNEDAFIRAIQWDTYGIEVLHVDFTRVSAGESIEATIQVELRGDAPGTREGGVLEQPIHQIAIRCPAMSIPEKIEVNINELGLNETITVAQLALPQGASALADADEVVVQCIIRDETGDEESTPLTGAEPEVIGRKAGEEE